jgi:TRAP-type C4-dicarboxylate transport system substrate-binding protein
MKISKVMVVGFVLGLALAGREGAFASAESETVTIKLASLVPEATPWGEAINKMAAEWDKASGGKVKMIVYHSGVAGSTEDDVLRKLNMNQIQAAMLSTTGLSQIDPAIFTLNFPFFIRTEQELDAVLAQEKQNLNKLIEKKGYYPLAWSKVGWVRFYSKQKVLTPSDLRPLKIGSDEKVPQLTDVLKQLGYRVVPIQMNQVLIALSGGQIDATYQAPAASAGLQLFGVAKNMASIPITPYLGCILMTQAAWNSIPAQFRPELQRIALEAERSLDYSVQALEKSVIEVMRENGLVINDISPAQAEEWYADFQRGADRLVEASADRSLYDNINALLKSMRKK